MSDNDDEYIQDPSKPATASQLYRVVKKVVRQNEENDLHDALRALKDKAHQRKKNMANNAKLWDTGFKVLSVLLTVIIVPTFTWVWSAQGRIATLELEVKTLKDEISNVRGDLSESIKNPTVSQNTLQNKTDIQLLRQEVEFLKQKKK